MAIEQLGERAFDAAVIDVRMPGVSGLELLAQIQQSERTRDIPVIVLTGLADRNLKRKALELGAADLLNKPLDAADLLARLRSVLRLKSYRDELKARNQSLERLVEERTLELLPLAAGHHLAARQGGGAARRGHGQPRDPRRVLQPAGGRGPGDEPRVPGERVRGLAAARHRQDRHPGPHPAQARALSPSEFATIQQHCRIGERILREESLVRKAFFYGRAVNSQFVADASNPILDVAAEIALAHHERWDGKGYPRGLAGEEIPLVSRIVAVCDVYDALISTRPYREAHSEDRALEMMADERGKHFDPDIYDAFLEALPKIRRSTAASPTRRRPPTPRKPGMSRDLVCR